MKAATLFRYMHPVPGDQDRMPKPVADKPDAVTWSDRRNAPMPEGLAGYDPLRVQNEQRGRW